MPDVHLRVAAKEEISALAQLLFASLVMATYEYTYDPKLQFLEFIFS